MMYILEKYTSFISYELCYWLPSHIDIVTDTPRMADWVGPEEDLSTAARRNVSLPFPGL